MANQLATPSWTLKEVGREYENNLKFIANVTKKYSDEYEQAGAKVGNTINYRIPQYWGVSDGQALDLQNILDQTVPISLTNQKHVDMGWSAWQETTEVEDVKRRYIDKAAASLASVIDALAFANVYRAVYQRIGTPGTTPTTNLVYLQAKRKLKDMSVPADDSIVAVLDTEQQVQLVNANFAIFNPASAISENWRRGMFGRGSLGIAEWYEDQNRPLFTTGASTTSSPRINGASQTGSTLNTNGWGSGTTNLKNGDCFKIAGVYSVNKLSKVSTGRLQEFVVTADTSDSTGAIASLPISPPLITSGPLQTVSNSPAASAVITLWDMADGGTQAATVSPTGMLFHPEAFAFVTADLARPAGNATFTSIASPARGVSFRMAEAWDPQTDQNITRIDTIVGAAALRPEWAARVQG